MPSDPRISPDARRVVYLEEWNDRASDSACANLWLVSIADKQPRRVTDGAWRDRSPRWSPDSTRIAWISGRGGIHVLMVDSGQEGAIEASPLALAWSHDGQSIAYTARMGTHTAVFVVPASGGPVKTVTGADFDAVGEPAWMRDGKSLVISAADGQIYSIRIADGVAHRLTNDTYRNESPLPSPDGTKIAWMATDSALHSYSIRRMHVMNVDGSHEKLLAGALDRDPVDPHWSSDSRTVYFLADDAGSTQVLAARNDSSIRPVTKGVERLSGLTLADNGHAAMVRVTGQSVEVVTFTADVPPANVAALAAPMAKLLAGRETSAAEEVHFPSAGKSIQGWVIKPPQFDAAKKYPLLLDFDDDPRRMAGPDLTLRAQIFAARGWVVLQVNPRGTPGYGEEFGRLLPTRYPGDDADDLVAAVDFVAAKGYVDPARIAVRGGLLAAWLLGHTDRFSAVVARRPIVDFTLEARRAAPWMGGMPWDDPDQYVRHSPIYFAQNWKTPTLLLAGSPDPQSDEFYFALQNRKVNSTMVRMADWDKPSAQVQEMETTLAWLEAH